MKKQNKGKFLKQSQGHGCEGTTAAVFVILAVFGISSFAFYKAGQRSATGLQETEPHSSIKIQEYILETQQAVVNEPEAIIAETAMETKETTEPPIIIEPPKITEPTEYIQPTTEAAIPAERTGAVRRSVDALNVRSGAGVGYDIISRLNGGEAVTVYEQTTVDGMTWGNIGYGWVSMDYIVFGVDNSYDNNQKTTNLLEYVGEWISNDYCWYMSITQNGSGVNLYAEYPYNTSEKTVWIMNGEFDEYTVIRYWDGICKTTVNGYETVTYSNGEGAINFCSPGIEWHDFTKGSSITLSRVGVHTTIPQNPTNNGDSSQNNMSQNNPFSVTAHPWHDEFLSDIITYVVKAAGGSNNINGDRWRCKMAITSIKDLGNGQYEVHAEGKYNKDELSITAIFEEGVIAFDFGWLAQPGDRYVILQKCTSLIWNYHTG